MAHRAVAAGLVIALLRVADQAESSRGSWSRGHGRGMAAGSGTREVRRGVMDTGPGRLMASRAGCVRSVVLLVAGGAFAIRL
jgi:hypothetical protein